MDLLIQQVLTSVLERNPVQKDGHGYTCFWCGMHSGYSDTINHFHDCTWRKVHEILGVEMPKIPWVHP